MSTDPDTAQILTLIKDLRAEADALEALISIAADAQWTAAPVARPREDTAERAIGRFSDPTSEIALDSGRLLCRSLVVRSRNLLQRAVPALREVRRGLARAVEPYGEA